MGVPLPGKKWFRAVRRKLSGSSSAKQTTVIILHNNSARRSSYSEATRATARRRISPEFTLSTTRQELAAVHIQACFRGHLARRAFRALKSLVRVQAIVRGVCVRRQARIALHCMHALARLQVTIRARQLLLARVIKS